MNNLKAIFDLHGLQAKVIYDAIGNAMSKESESEIKCLECQRIYDREPRVEAGMRCGRCSYGLTCHNGHRI